MNCSDCGYTFSRSKVVEWSIFTLPPRFASGRVAAALRGRRGGPAVAVPVGEPSPAKAPTLPLAKPRREGDVLVAAAAQSPRNLSGGQPQPFSSPG